MNQAQRRGTRRGIHPAVIGVAGGAAAFFASLAILFSLVKTSEDSQGRAAGFGAEPGATIVLRMGKAEQVLLASSYDDQKELVKLLVAKDTLGEMQLLNADRVFFVPSGTKALVVERHFLTGQVRILEGEQKGRAGWIEREFMMAK